MPHDPQQPGRQPGPPRAGDDAALQKSVDRHVPEAERLPERADENPLSRQVRGHATEGRKGPGRSTLQGGDKVSD
ncbi:MAG: hypothetical protein U1E14_17470 [Geminicoccaceae bacterium]